MFSILIRFLSFSVKKLDSLVVHDLFNVMEKDSVETTHPVSFEVENPKEVQQYFDEISYDKVRKNISLSSSFKKTKTKSNNFTFK